MPVLYALVILLVSINFLLGLPKAVDTVQTTVSANNVPNNQVLTVAQAQSLIAGVQKRNPLPKSSNLLTPPISATASVIEDVSSGSLLFVKDPNKRVPIASTTKIMTALVASEYFKANDILTAGDFSMVPGSSMGLKLGEKLSFRSLLYGMLLNSGNDAAYTIAGNYPGGVSGFVEAMNQKSQKLGLLNTHFDNPAGFDSLNHYSSAADLAKIATLVTTDSQLSRVVSTKETEVASIDKTSIHELKNLNKLLNFPGVLGIKTGTTPAAKENLVGLVERDGHQILTVILGSDDRFGETEKLIDWTYANFAWE